MGWFLGISGVLQLLIALWAVHIGRAALRVSERALADANRQRQRADQRERLQWMQTLLNELQPLQQARAANDDRIYRDRQRWIRTALAVSGLRAELPATVALSNRPHEEGWAGMVDTVDKAWEEIHDALGVAADRAYAGQRG